MHAAAPPPPPEAPTGKRAPAKDAATNVLQTETFDCPSKYNTSVQSAAYTADGKQLVASFYYAGTHSSTIRVWDAQSGKLTREIPAGDHAEVSADGRYFATWNRDGGGTTIVAIGGAGEKDYVVKKLPDANPDRGAVSLLPGGILMSTNGKEKVVLWDAKTGKKAAELEGHGNTDMVTRGAMAVFSADGSRVASVGVDPGNSHVFGDGPDPSSIRVWDTKSKKQLLSIKDGMNGHYTQYALSPDGTRLAAANSNVIRLFDVDSGRSLGSFPRGDNLISQVRFSPDGRRLFWGDSYFEEKAGGKLHEADLATMKETTTRGEFPASVDWIAPSPDGKRVAVYAAKEGGGCGFTIFPVGSPKAEEKLKGLSFEDLWKKLSTGTPEEAESAARQLAQPGFRKQLETQLAPALMRSDKKLEVQMKKLTNDLGEDDFETREAASKEIGAFLTNRARHDWFFSKVQSWAPTKPGRLGPVFEDAEIEARVSRLRAASDATLASAEDAAMGRLTRALAVARPPDPFLTKLAEEGDGLSSVVQHARSAVASAATVHRGAALLATPPFRVDPRTQDIYSVPERKEEKEEDETPPLNL